MVSFGVAGNDEIGCYVTSWLLAKQEESIWPTGNLTGSDMDCSSFRFAGKSLSFLTKAW